MTRDGRFKTIFLAVCAIFFALACIATAQVMIQVILWFVNHCHAASPLCTATDLLISYWWLLFVPLTLLVAVFARSLYAKLHARYAR
jgi:hypothetical protein